MEKPKSIVQKVIDGWQNVVTGLAVKGIDKRTGAQAFYERMSQADAEHLYASDDMAAAIVDLLPEEMLREGWDAKSNDDTFVELPDLVVDYFDEFCLNEKLLEALCWARMYGGSLLVIGANDGGVPREPLNEEKIKSIDYLTLVHRWEALPRVINIDPSSKNFGMPEIYAITPSDSGGAGIAEVHHSRVIRFDGARLPKRFFIGNNYWHESVFSKLMNPLRNFHAAHDSAACLIQDFAQAVFKMKNLSEAIAQGADGLVEKRLALVDRTRSLVKAIVIEDEEDFERKGTPVTGLKELLDKVDQRLVQASRIPHTRLLGESPSGLGATGNSEMKDWYDYVSRQQETQLKKPLLKLVTLALRSQNGPTKGTEPKNWDICFRPLQQVDPKADAEVKKLKADTDHIYIQDGVLDPNEVALARFSSRESEIKIDVQARKNQPVEIGSEKEEPEEEKKPGETQGKTANETEEDDKEAK